MPEQPWEWYRDGAAPPTKREMWKPYVYAGTGEDAMPEIEEEE